MPSPLRFDAGFEDAPLDAAGDVRLRALRLMLGFAAGPAGAVIAFSRPVAVIDRRQVPARVRPVFDPALALSALAFALALLRLAGRIRRRRAASPTADSPDTGG